MSRLCAKCARPSSSLRIEQGLPVCDPECRSIDDPTQLRLDLPISDRELAARNLRYTLTGSL